MAAVITIQAGPTASSFQQAASHSPESSRRRPSKSHQQLQHNPSSSSPSTPLSPVSANLAAASRASGRDGSSCDACLQRKSRCAMNEIVNKCYSCDFHRQECTFILSTAAQNQDPSSKKRKLDESSPENIDSAKRYVNMKLCGGNVGGSGI